MSVLNRLLERPIFSTKNGINGNDYDLGQAGLHNDLSSKWDRPVYSTNHRTNGIVRTITIPYSNILIILEDDKVKIMGEFSHQVEITSPPNFDPTILYNYTYVPHIDPTFQNNFILLRKHSLQLRAQDCVVLM